MDGEGDSDDFSIDRRFDIVVIGAICFWAIDKFANDRRLAQL